ncbi:MAG: phosphoglucosamine mutase [Anaeroplasmataceae bacterium]
MKYFGTDGIRGIPGKSLSYDFLFKIGYSLKAFNNDVIIATDTRISKDMIVSSISSGILMAGININYVGVLSTSGLIYLSYIKGLTGVMITASHNPYMDNGIKIVNKGYKLSDYEELMLEALIDNYKIEELDFGTIHYNYPKIEYFNFLENYIIKSNLKICIDCANGALCEIAPIIFKKVTNDLVIINDKPNGFNINYKCGSTYLDNLRYIVKKNACDIGFAYDGDGDRVNVIDSNGNIIDGDMIIYIISMYLYNNGNLKNNSVVLSKMSNLGIVKALKEKGIKVIETPVGDKYIIKELTTHNLSIGGEASGHIIMKDIFHTGDGVLISLLLIKILQSLNKKIDDYYNEITLYPSKLLNINVGNKNQILSNEALLLKIEEIKKNDNDCKVIIRSSGTEDLIRLLVMAKTDYLVKKYTSELIDFIK